MLSAAWYVVLSALLGLSLGFAFAFLLRIPAAVRRNAFRSISDEIRA